MSSLEAQIRQMRIDFKKELMELRRMIAARMVADKWVPQSTACALLNCKPRQLRNLRVHLDKNKLKTGHIGWKKGKGKSSLYYLPDIEKYRGAFVIMN